MSKKDLESLGLFGSILGHVGDGNFHETILFGEKDRENVERCVEKMVRRALQMEGTCTVSVCVHICMSANKRRVSTGLG